ncbi:hypothetical protein ACFW04_012482 [Cataglyphis niger]
MLARFNLDDCSYVSYKMIVLMFPYKKKKCDNRRCASMPTSYKYLEIEISVGAVSCVEMVLGDNRGNHIVLSFEMWKSLMQKRLLQSSQSPLRI